MQIHTLSSFLQRILSPGKQKIFASFALAAIVAACGGGGGGGSGGTGNLHVSLTDAPSCGYDHVYVTVEKVRVHQSGTAADSETGWSEIVLQPAKRIDLLTLTNGSLADLGTTTLPAGDYTQLRLVLADNSAANLLANAVTPAGGAETALSTPSAQQIGLKIKTNVAVAANQVTNLVLDFDACKSVVRAGNSGRYNLKPVITAFLQVDAGIEGYVVSPLANGNTTVSAQQNGQAVRATVPDASGKFVLTLLPAGTYSLVVTADGYQSAAIAGVPVMAAGKTAVNTATSSIALGTSSMSVISGTVSVNTTSATGTVTAPLTSATVAVLQTIDTAGLVSLQSQPVDAELATYSLRVPQAAPLAGTYVAGAAPGLGAAAAGQYQVRAQATGFSDKTANVDASASDVTQSFVFP